MRVFCVIVISMSLAAGAVLASKKAYRRSVAAGDAFDPTSIEGLYFWFKADAITGLSDGDPVPLWVDSSGNGRYATNNASTDRPVYKSSILNGLPSVLFDDGTDTTHLTNALNATIAQSNRYFVVAYSTNFANENRLFDTSAARQSTRSYSAISYAMELFGTGSFNTGNNLGTNWYIFEFLFNGAASAIWTNGVESATGSVTSDGSGMFYLGTSKFGGGSWNGYISELLLYEDITPEDSSLVRGYLNDKYAIY